MPSSLWAQLVFCVHAVYAHLGITATVAIVLLSVANKLLPGHPRFSGFARLLVSLLAASPMAGARSAAFLILASKLGDGPAAAFVHWLSTWLDIPLLSKSVTAPGGQPTFRGGRSVLAFAAVLVLASSTACGLFKSSFGADEKACGTAAVTAIEQQVARILLGDSDNYLADLENLALRVGTDTVICAVQVALADFQGLQATSSRGALAAAGTTYSDAIARGKVALAKLSGG